MKSASGGIFAAMATTILKDGGVVFGAALDFENGHAHPHHIAVREVSQLYRLQGLIMLIIYFIYIGTLYTMYV